MTRALWLAVPASAAVVLARAGLFDPARLARGASNLALFAGDMWPPDTDPAVWRTLLLALWETLQMAWAGTVLGAALALPLAVLAAAPLSRPLVARSVRALLAAVRTIPAILWAIVLVILVGFGPLAGILAISAYTCGHLGKLLSEALEGVDPELLDAARATGASPAQVARHAVIPETGNALLSQAIYAFEYNVRASSIVGLVGAGGIGFHVLRSLELFRYGRLAAALLLLFATVVATEAAGRAVRRRYLAARA